MFEVNKIRRKLIELKQLGVSETEIVERCESKILSLKKW